MAEILRRSHKPVLVVANKVDDSGIEPEAAAFFRLGLGDPVVVSALHGRGSGDFLDRLLEILPAGAEEVDLDWGAAAIVGTPERREVVVGQRLAGGGTGPRRQRSRYDPGSDGLHHLDGRRSNASPGGHRRATQTDEDRRPSRILQLPPHSRDPPAGRCHRAGDRRERGGHRARPTTGRGDRRIGPGVHHRSEQVGPGRGRRGETRRREIGRGEAALPRVGADSSYVGHDRAGE